MILKNHTYLFGKIPEEYKDNSEDEYYFAFQLCAKLEVCMLVDSRGRSVPIDFCTLYNMQEALTNVIFDLQAAVVGQ